MKKEHKIYISFFVLALLAVLDASYLTYLHYNPDASTFCDFAPGLSCSIVNKSIYSELFGIPVSILGLLSLVLLSIMCNLVYKKKGFLGIKRKTIALAMFIILICADLFSLWLIFVQAFLLFNFCLFCLGLDALIFTESILSWIIYKRVS